MLMSKPSAYENAMTRPPPNPGSNPLHYPSNHLGSKIGSHSKQGYSSNLHNHSSFGNNSTTMNFYPHLLQPTRLSGLIGGGSSNSSSNRAPSTRTSLKHSAAQAVAKNVSFYRSGDTHMQAFKVAITRRHFRTFDSLLESLSDRIPLPFGVRTISTPHGTHGINKLEEFEDGKAYVCSDKKTVKPLNLNAAQHPKPPWFISKPKTRTKAVAQLIRRPDADALRVPLRLTQVKTPKKIVIVRNGEPNFRHSLLLSRRTPQSFENILDDIGEIFRMRVHKLYTSDGRKVESLQSIYLGPNIFVAAGREAFQPMEYRLKRVAISEGKKDHSTVDLQNLNKERTPKELKKTKGRWRVSVVTSELPAAATDARVNITVYGVKGNSGPILLNGGNDATFKSGNEDEFAINVGSIGEIRKIRIAHDNSGKSPGWLCESLTLSDVTTGQILNFPCNRWLSRDEDDGEICRELAANWPDKPTLPYTAYVVAITTGNLWNSGTSANVHLTLFGDMGDSGPRLLQRGGKSEAQVKGTTNIYKMEAVSLGLLHRIVVGHDGLDKGSGWFLERIVVREDKSGAEEWTFPCDRWLDVGEGDGRIIRELYAENSSKTNTYTRGRSQAEKPKIDLMWELEKWKFQRGNHLVLISQATEKALRVRPDAGIDGLGDPSLPSSTFEVSRRRSNIRVFCNVGQPSFHIALDQNRTLGHGKGGSFCEFQVKVQQDRTVLLESVKYPGQHVTVDPAGKPADTRGHPNALGKIFFVHVKGCFRHNSVILLNTSPTQALAVTSVGDVVGTGRRTDDESLTSLSGDKQYAYFRVLKVAESVRMFQCDKEPKRFLRIKDGQCDGWGNGDAYCHFKVHKHRLGGFITLEAMKHRGVFVGLDANGKARPTVDTGDVNTQFYPEVISFGERRKERSEAWKSPEHSFVMSSYEETKPTVDTYRVSPDKLSVNNVVTLQGREKSNTGPVDGDFRIYVTTGNSGTTESISLHVYGDKKYSGAITLGKGTEGGVFQCGQTDEFQANLASVGELRKIRIGVEEITSDCQWRLKQVKMKDMNTNQIYRFKFNRWISRQKDDGATLRELPVMNPDGNLDLPILRYFVLARTSSESARLKPNKSNPEMLETQHEIYLCIHGEYGDTGRRFLLRKPAEFPENPDLPNKALFLPGQLDKFEIEAVSLGELSKCVISCPTSSSMTSLAWLCDEIVVRESEGATQEYVFRNRNKWLGTQKVGAKPKVKLELSEKREVKKQRSTSSEYKEGDWKVSVTTGSENECATSSNVMFYACGEQGSTTGPVFLGCGAKGLFAPGTTEQFKINFSKVTNLQKIRLSQDNTGKHPSWYVERIKMKCATDDVTYTLDVGKWLRDTKEPYRLFLEIPIPIPGQELARVLRYQVLVYTGSLLGSDTDANVFITIFGSKGDTARRPLSKSLSHDVKFQESQVDVFEVEAVDLGELTKIEVGHDGIGHGNGWFLHKVIVKESEMAPRDYVFFCNKWLDDGQDDGKIVRTIEVEPLDVSTESDPPAESVSILEVTDHTTESKNSNKEFSHQINSEEQLALDSSSVPLAKSSSPQAITPSSSKEDQKLPTSNFPDDVEAVPPPSSSEEPPNAASSRASDYYFQKAIHDFINKREESPDGSEATFVMQQTPNSPSRPFFKFDVSRRSLVTASSRRSLSRHDDIALDDDDEELIRPSEGKYDVIITTASESSSEPCPESAYLTIVVYGEDGKSGEIRLKPDAANSSNVDCFSRGQADTFQIEVADVGQIYKIRLSLNGSPDWPGLLIEQVVLEDLLTRHRLVFNCNRWLSNVNDDKETVRELALAKNNDDVLSVNLYFVSITTGDRPAAATDANVFLTLRGERGDSGKRKLSYAQGESFPFQRNTTSSFVIEAVDLGKLKEVLLSHDGMGEGAGWFVEKVTVRENEFAPVEWVFPGHVWLDDHVADCKTTRKLRLLGTFDVVNGDEELSKLASPPSREITTAGTTKYDVTVVVDEVMTQGNSIARLKGVLYGEAGVTREFPLGDWLPGREKIFTGRVDIEAVGEIKKIRVFVDDSSRDLNLFLMTVTLRDVVSNEIFDFNFNRKFRTGSGSTVKELPALKGNAPSRNLTNYFISVDMLPSNDDVPSKGKLQLKLTGKNGDSGFRTLFRGMDGFSAVKREGGYLFEQEAVNLSELTHVTISYVNDEVDRIDAGGWQVGNITIKPAPLPNSYAGGPDNVIYSALVNHTFESKSEEKVFNLEQVEESNAKELFLPLSGIHNIKPEQVESEGIWKIFITSSVFEEASVFDRISVQLFGTLDSSDVIPISLPDVHVDDVIENTVVERQIRTQDLKLGTGLGELYHLRVRLNNDSMTRIFKIKLKDSTTNEEYLLHLSAKQRMDTRANENGVIIYDFPLLKPDQEQLKHHKYAVQVKTGSTASSSTDADIKMTIFGTDGDTGSRSLRALVRDPDSLFQQGQEDTFNFETVDVGEPRKIIIGHSAKGGGAGWFLEEVTISEARDDVQSQFVFPCHKWLDDSVDDKLTQRELHVSAIRTIQPHIDISASKGNWKFHVKAKKDVIKKKELDVKFTLCLTGRRSREFKGHIRDENHVMDLRLEDNEPPSPSTGEVTSQFVKLRVEIENVKDDEKQKDWPFEECFMIDDDSGEKIRFLFDSAPVWEGSHRGSIREIPVLRSNGLDLPVNDYYVIFYTNLESDHNFSPSQVTCQLQGQYGSTGWRNLLQNSTASGKFQPGRVDVFPIEAVCLGDVVDRVMIDVKGPAENNWKLDRIKVKRSFYEEEEFVFECDREVVPGSQTELSLSNTVTAYPPKPATVPTKPNVKSGQQQTVFNLDMTWSGLNSLLKTAEATQGSSNNKSHSISVQLSGSKGFSELTQVNLKDAEVGKDGKHRSNLEVSVPTNVFGDFTKLGLGVLEPAPLTEPSVNCLLYKVSLRNKDTNQYYSFLPKHSFFKRNEDQTKTGFNWLELAATRPRQDPSTIAMACDYVISIRTGNHDDASTSAHVYVTLVGENGDSGKRWLMTSSTGSDDVHASGRSDEFDISSFYLGDLSQVIIGHDGRDVTSSWLLDDVTVTSSIAQKKQYIFVCKKWLANLEEETFIERTLDLHHVIDSESETKSAAQSL